MKCGNRLSLRDTFVSKSYKSSHSVYAELAKNLGTRAMDDQCLLEKRRWFNLLLAQVAEKPKDKNAFELVIHALSPYFGDALKSLSPQSIGRLVCQQIGTRLQLMDKYGEMVLTDFSQIEAGGQHLNRSISQDKLRWFVIGDTGEAGADQKIFIEDLRQRVQKGDSWDATAEILALGDFVYPHGPEGKSPDAYQRFKDVVSPIGDMASIAPVYGALGNHEYGDGHAPGDVNIFLPWAREAGIRFPGRYYSRMIESQTGGEAPNWRLHKLCLDSTSFCMDIDQRSWLEQRLAEIKGEKSSDLCKTYTVLLSHHPIFSQGLHQPYLDEYRAALTPYLKDIDLHIAAHEHDIEINLPKKQAGRRLPPVVVSGCTSQRRPGIRSQDEAATSCFFSDKLGSVEVVFDQQDIKIQVFEVDKTGPVHRQSLAKLNFGLS